MVYREILRNMKSRSYVLGESDHIGRKPWASFGSTVFSNILYLLSRRVKRQTPFEGTLEKDQLFHD